MHRLREWSEKVMFLYHRQEGRQSVQYRSLVLADASTWKMSSNFFYFHSEVQKQGHQLRVRMDGNIGSLKRKGKENHLEKWQGIFPSLPMIFLS